ncbi:MAG: hypothetical protein RLZZ507_2348 [Cyanobacteriota bacterium]|jgi:filamentous hemagglutinin family protein
MKFQKKEFYYHLFLTIILFIGGLINNKSASAQLTPDNTLGAKNSIVKPVDSLKDRIEGGVTRGVNLFHSFQEFNVDAGKSVYFANPLRIENILTRVTGSNVSNIFGTLGVEGAANLFLINPNGIFFGNGASLNISGSFTATTADGIRLGETGLFSATHPQTSNLLTVQPGALFRNALRNQTSEIRNESNLTVGQNLTFDADNINLSGRLQAGGDLNLKANQTISINRGNINTDNNGTGQGRDINITTGSLYLTNSSVLSANTLDQGDGGTVKITATDTVRFDGGSNATSQVGFVSSGKGGSVDISSGSLELLGGSFLSVSTFGQGDAGSVNITTQSLKLDGSSLTASTTGQGDGGIVKITATDTIKFNAGSSIQVETGAAGQAGSVEISTGSLELLGGSRLTANTLAQGDAGIVKITATDNIKLDGSSSVESAVASGARVTAGDVDISTRSLVEISTKSLELLGGSRLEASTFARGNAGTIRITATDTVKFDAGSFAQSAVGEGGVGNAGGVEISARSLEVLGGSFLEASTLAQGNAGTVRITDADTVKFDSGSFAQSAVRAGAVGNAGGVEISTKSLEVLGGSRLEASTFARGNAGTIRITDADTVKFDSGSFAQSAVGEGAVGNAGGVEISTKSLEVLGGSRLEASTFARGNAGTIRITDADTVKFDDGSFAQSAVGSGAVGNAGGVEISTKSLEVLGGSTLEVSTLAQGNAGTVRITAADSVKFDGRSSAQSAVLSGGVGNAGGVEVSTRSLEVLGGSSLSAITSGQEDAGTINITANTFTATTGGEVVSTTFSSAQAGNINLNIRDRINLDGARIAVNSQGGGQGGDISITAGLLSLDNQALITAATDNSQGGNINLLAISDLLLLRNNSEITATAGTAQAAGDGGNITINTPFIVAFPQENSDITANAFEGNGGRISINTNSIFGLEFRNQLTPLSDITVSSEFGLAGDVEINTPEVDPTSGLINLPTSLVDIESLNKDVCAVKDDKIAGGSSFIITGKGGLPADTNELISNSPAYVEWENNSEVVTESQPSPVKVTQRNKNDVPEIQEAQGWIITPDGKVILIADAAKVTLQSHQDNLPRCK